MLIGILKRGRMKRGKNEAKQAPFSEILRPMNPPAPSARDTNEAVRGFSLSTQGRRGTGTEGSGSPSVRKGDSSTFLKPTGLGHGSDAEEQEKEEKEEIRDPVASEAGPMETPLTSEHQIIEMRHGALRW